MTVLQWPLTTRAVGPAAAGSRGDYPRAAEVAECLPIEAVVYRHALIRSHVRELGRKWPPRGDRESDHAAGRCGGQADGDSMRVRARCWRPLVSVAAEPRLEPRNWVPLHGDSPGGPKEKKSGFVFVLGLVLSFSPFLPSPVRSPAGIGPAPNASSVQIGMSSTMTHCRTK